MTKPWNPKPSPLSARVTAPTSSLCLPFELRQYKHFFYLSPLDYVAPAASQHGLLSLFSMGKLCYRAVDQHTREEEIIPAFEDFQI